MNAEPLGVFFGVIALGGSERVWKIKLQLTRSNFDSVYAYWSHANRELHISLYECVVYWIDNRRMKFPSLSNITDPRRPIHPLFVGCLAIKTETLNYVE